VGPERAGGIVTLPADVLKFSQSVAVAVHPVNPVHPVQQQLQLQLPL
jgi:hypothetical protein